MLTRLAVAGTLVLLLAGCVQKSQAGSTAPVGSSTGSGTPSASASSSTVTRSPIPFSPPPPTTITPARPSASATVEAGGCPTSALTIRALRGSGAAGHQFAFVQFTNASASTCSLTGYPGIQLLLAGKPLGQPAVRSGKPIRTVPIPPGSSVSANLVTDSSCNASISDSVQVIPPNRTDRIVLKLALRGCPLTVDPVAPS